MLATTVTDITSNRSRHLVLAICSTGLLMVGLDATIVNIALPAIHRSLGSSLAGLQWTVDAYTLVLASLLMLAGSTADRVGRKRVFQLGLLVFSLGSLLCALAPTQGVLIAARVLQAIGGSMLSPVAMSIIRTVFVDPAERARAIGVYAAMFGLSIALGPVLGGMLVDAVGWRAVFLVNVPVGALAVVATHRFVPESRAERPRRFDPVGQILVIVGLASLTYGIIEGPDHGWASVDIVAALAVAALALAALIPYELRRREPLLEMRWFRSAPFSGASAIALCAFAALGAFLFLNTLYLQDVRGLSPLRAGLCMLPMAAMVLVFAPLSGRLVGSRGPRPPLLAAGVALIAAVAMLTQLQAVELDRLRAHRLHGVRGRLRLRQPADHQHRRLWHARLTGRRRRRRGLDQPPGRPDAGSGAGRRDRRRERRARRRRRGRLHRRGPAGVVDDPRRRRRRPRARGRVHDTLGRGDRTPHRRGARLTRSWWDQEGRLAPKTLSM